MKNKVYINGRFLTQRTTGVQRFAINLFMALDDELDSYPNSQVELILLTPISAVVELKLKKSSQRKVGRLSGHLWEQIELPFFSRDGLLINFCNIGPAFKRNQFVTICDAAVFRFPRAYKAAFVIWYRLLAYLNSTFSKRVITISEFSKSELINFLKVREDKISIIYPGVKFTTSMQNDKILDRLSLKSQGYFLAVGSVDVRKNFAGIINGFMQLEERNVELVIVGGGYSSVFSAQKNPEDKRIKRAGYLEDDELISLYTNAIAFVYPSFYEGFGIPPLEAMTFGCPVIVSNAASLPEVCRDSALYCDPYDSGSIMRAMKDLLHNTELRSELSQKASKRLSDFSYQKSAQKLMTLLGIKSV